MRRWLTGIALATSVAGCAVAPGPVRVQAVDGASPAAAPVAAATPTASAVVYNGVARYGGLPLAGATVTAYLMGPNTPLGTAIVGTDGQFRMVFKAQAPVGALVRLAATQNGHTVATVATVPGALKLQALLDYVLDERHTLVYLALGQRLEALGALTLGADGQVAREVAAQAFAAFTEALDAAFDVPGAAGALEGTLATDGRILANTATLRDLLKQVSAGLATVFTAKAELLATLIRAQVALGKPKPDDALLGGTLESPAVFPQQHSDSSGASDPDIQPDATGLLVVEDGSVVNVETPPAFEMDAAD